MHRTRHILATCSLAALLGVPGLRAQQQQAQPAQQPSQQQPAQTQDQSAAPIPAYHSPLASQADNGENPAPADSGDVVPNDRALSGAQNLSLGSPETSRSYWQPHADVIATANTNAFGGTSGWTTYSSLLGGVDIHKIEGRSDTTLGVVGGAILSNDGGTNNYAISEVTFAERLTVRRFKFSFLDNMDYLPQAGLGYGGGFGLGLPGGGSLGLQPGLTPTDGILTTQGSRIDNSFLAESDVSLTRRSSLTLLGGYSLLDYLGNSLSQLNFHTITGQAGYNRKLSAKDNVAVFYRFHRDSLQQCEPVHKRQCRKCVLWPECHRPSSPPIGCGTGLYDLLDSGFDEQYGNGDLEFAVELVGERFFNLSTEASVDRGVLFSRGGGWIGSAGGFRDRHVDGKLLQAAHADYFGRHQRRIRPKPGSGDPRLWDLQRVL